MPTLYDYLDRHVRDLPDDDVFTLSAVRTWVFAARNGRCAQVMLRNGFAFRHVDDGLLAFMCVMALLDRHGHGTMRFAEACHPAVNDDEARVLNLFAAARIDDPRLIPIAASLVTDEMAARLASTASKVADVMRLHDRP